MSNASGLTLPPQSVQPPTQRAIVLFVLALLTAGAVALSGFGWRQSVLFLIGSLFGVSLYHASFGFASAYRRLFVYGEVRAIRAQMLMLMAATVLFAPILISGTAFGQKVTGAVAPMAVQGAIGAFLFGIGMQLGSGCACGTLYTIGGGSSMMLLTLLTFGIGAFWASLTGNVWAGLPKTEPLSLITLWGWAGVAVQLLGLGLIAAVLWRWEQKNRIRESEPPQPFSFRTLLYGPWSLAFGAIALALLNWITLLIAGRPWGVTWGFTLWTAKIAQQLGWNPATSEFWSQGMGATALSQSVFADVISVMNFALC